MKFLKESEHEKISNELLNKLVPMDALNSYYLYGVAATLNHLNIAVKQYRFKDEKDGDFFKDLIEYICLENLEIKSYYDRLSK